MKSNKKNFIYFQVLIVLFIVLVIGASYSYFASSSNISATSNLITQVGTMHSFTSTSATNFNINVTTADMQQSMIGNSITSDLGSINVNLTVPDGLIVACTYDLLFSWTSSDKYLIPSTELPYTDPNGTTYNYEFSTKITNESGSIIEGERDLSMVNKGNGFTNNNGVYSGTIAEDIKITAYGETVTETYNIEAKIYNLPVNQINIINKKMTADIKVSNVECNYHNMNYLSTNSGNTIINLVNRKGIDTSAIDSIYFVNTLNKAPNSDVFSASFEGADGNEIKAWTEGTNLYLGSINKVTIGPSMSHAFSGKYLNVLDLTDIDTSYVTNMSNAFYSLGSNAANFIFNLGDSFNTANVTNMSGMFAGVCSSCNKFTFNLGANFDTSNVTDMSNMFASIGTSSKNTSSFTLNLREKFNTSKVTNMSGMFKSIGTYNGSFYLNLGTFFNTSNVTNMSNMFYGFGSRSTYVGTININNTFDTSNVLNMSSMFQSMARYANSFTLNINNFYAPKVTNADEMFSGVGYYSKNSVSMSINNIYLPKISNASKMFSYCGRNANTSRIYLNNFNIVNVTDMSGMFEFVGMQSRSSVTISLEQLNISNVTNISEMFSSAASNAKTTSTLSLDDSFNTSKVTNMAYFMGGGFDASNSTHITLGNNFDTSNVVNMYRMFYQVGMSSKTTFNFSLNNKFDTSNVEDMSYMFYNVGKNSTTFLLNLGNHFNTVNVTKMPYMFFGIGDKLSNYSLNLGNLFDTSNVVDMSHMFSYTGGNSTNFTIKLPNKFSTYKVENMSNMFENAGLNSTNFTLNLGNSFYTNNVVDMSSMFTNTGKNAAWTLDLKKFNFNNVSKYSNFFTDRTEPNILTVLCNQTNSDFINARVGTFTGYNIVCN